MYYRWVESGQEEFNAPTAWPSVPRLLFSRLGRSVQRKSYCVHNKNGLTTSDMLGKCFSGNGDVLGFAYNTDRQINSIGYGNRGIDTSDPVGPCITGMIDLRGQANLNDGMVIEEGVIPGALSSESVVSGVCCSGQSGRGRTQPIAGH